MRTPTKAKPQARPASPRLNGWRVEAAGPQVRVYDTKDRLRLFTPVNDADHRDLAERVARLLNQDDADRLYNEVVPAAG